MIVETRRWRFTVEDFTRMAEAGIFAPEDRVELIDGEVREMSPIGPDHSGIVNRLTSLLVRQAGEEAIVSVQNPVQLSDYTQPQPDFAVLRYRDDFYRHAHPLPTDVYFLVEIADSSLDYDQEEKIPRYAEASIPEVWIVDVNGESITQYTQPDGRCYRSQQTLRRQDELVCTSLNRIRLFVDQIFG